MNRQDEPEVNLEQLIGGCAPSSGAFAWAAARRPAGRRRGRLAVVVVVWAATGLYQVSSEGGERAVLRLFGRYNGEVGPGLHWFWPGPIGKRTIVRTTEVKRLELGFRGETPVPEESLMITGDINIVDAQLLVQYDIKSARDFLFRVVDPDGVTIKDATETAPATDRGRGEVHRHPDRRKGDLPAEDPRYPAGDPGHVQDRHQRARGEAAARPAARAGAASLRRGYPRHPGQGAHPERGQRLQGRRRAEGRRARPPVSYRRRRRRERSGSTARRARRNGSRLS